MIAVPQLVIDDVRSMKPVPMSWVGALPGD